MKLCDYVSNTVAGSGNQYYFLSDKGEQHTSRVFYKIASGGSYTYTLMFTNIIDSTFSDGSISRKNMICEEWDIASLKASVCKSADPDRAPLEMPENIGEMQELTFDGKSQKTVSPGEVFFTDSFSVTAEKGDYLCVEMTFSGTMLPCHEESILPIFRRTAYGWVYDRNMPLPSFVGCKRKVKAKIGFVGDSITQGIGTALNSYRHWNALLSEMLGGEYAYWNLGLGFGRANDLASDGIWMEKALENDIVFVCFGVNDLLQGFSVEQIKNDLEHIAQTLVSAGKTVIFQTLPPFDYCGDRIAMWKEINRFILEDLAKKVDFVFDNTAILGKEGELHMAKYCGHPNEEGCARWADELFKKVMEAGIFE